MRISVVGAGYVGLSLATLFSARFDTLLVDIIPEKIDSINSRVSPISDRYIERYFSEEKLTLRATLDLGEVIGSDYVVIATPTNYDPETTSFDTSSVEEVLENLRKTSPGSVAVIKSTIPIGFTEEMRSSVFDNILFSPEFLREGHALYDNLYPSRIVMGIPGEDDSLRRSAERFAAMLGECAIKKDVPVFFTGASEAESVKLFSNSYLAMRVAFFNELDSFAEMRGLDSRAIIEGVCTDSRIGDHYNNPSFGYGGYCLPKDTRQLLLNYEGIPNSIVSAIVHSNELRKRFVADRIKAKVSKSGPCNKIIGIHRITMKTGSDNFRQSSVIDVIDILQKEGFSIVIYEPLLDTDCLGEWTVEKDLARFKKDADVIIANRFSDDLLDVQDKVYTRDLFLRD